MPSDSEQRLRAGDLRHRVGIQQLTETGRSSTGDPIRTWATVATVWALVRPLSSRERAHAAQEASTRTHEVVLRAYSGLTSEMRLSYKGRLFGITELIDPLEIGKLMRLGCEEVDAP